MSQQKFLHSFEGRYREATEGRMFSSKQQQLSMRKAVVYVYIKRSLVTPFCRDDINGRPFLLFYVLNLTHIPWLRLGFLTLRVTH